MTVTNKIKQLLDSQGADYTFFEHEPTPTCEDTAKIKNIPEGISAKSLILRGKKTGTYYMVVVPCAARLDMKKVKIAVGDACSFASHDVVNDFGFVVGGVAPFGFIVSMRTLFDESVLAHEQVSFNAGEQTCSIVMKSKDFRAIIEGLSPVKITNIIL